MAFHWLQCHNVCTKFHENWSSGLNIELDTCMHSMAISWGSCRKEGTHVL